VFDFLLYVAVAALLVVCAMVIYTVQQPLPRSYH
jgi:hypothetical protein